jgi:hypothetical protein
MTSYRWRHRSRVMPGVHARWLWWFRLSLDTGLRELAQGGLEFAGQQAALGWLEAERANLLAAVGQAVATPGVPAELGMRLAQALFGFFRYTATAGIGCVQA